MPRVEVRSRTWRLGAALAAAAIGALVSVQSRINAELATRLDDSLQAATVSLVSGLLVLLVLVPLVPSMRRGLRAIPGAVREGALPWWCLLGGVGGAVFLASQTYSVPVIGVALFTVSVVAGQTASSLYVDRVGIGGSGRTGVTPQRVAAAVIAVFAVVLSVGDKFGSATFSVIAVVAGIVAGAASAGQQAVNGRVATTVRSPMSATLVSIATSAVTLLALLAVRALWGTPMISPQLQPWWLYTGGLFGIVYIAVAALVVGHLGVLLFSLCQIAGQVCGALLLDLLVPTRLDAVTPATLAGAGLTVVAVLVGAGAVRRRSRSAGATTRPPTR